MIVGATAVGKTEYSLELADTFDGEVVSADSRCIYRGMDIGTAKPNANDIARVPHHLLDVTTPDLPWSLAEYKRAATYVISDIQERGYLPLLVGGTGQYVHSIVEGWEIPPRSNNDEIRAKLQETARTPGGQAVLCEQLAVLDPVSASSIDKHNVRRVIRALEVCILTGRPFSEQRIKTTPNYDMFLLGLRMPRAVLYSRIDERIDAMLRAGWVEEVQVLLDMGYGWDLPAMSALGYRHIGAYLCGEIDLAEAKSRIRRASRRLVRKQAAWFRSEDDSIHWYDVGDASIATIKGDISAWCSNSGVDAQL